MSEMKTISVDNLFVDPQQSRSWETRIDEEFKESIRRHGVINPLTVREKHTESEETAGKKGLPDSPAGEQEYYVVAGRRRLDAAIEVGLHEIDCVVNEYNDEEAASISLEENEHRKSLTQLELAKSVKKRYDIMAEDLVGEDETVECPVDGCNKDDCNGRQGLKTHLQMKHGGSRESRHPHFLGKDEIYSKIAEDSSFDIDTVRNLVNVASIPEQFQAFVKIPEERTADDEEIVERLIGSNFTFANQERESIVSQKTIDFARFLNDKPARLAELTLKRRDFRNATTSETKEIFDEVSNAWKGWKEEDVEGDIGYNNSVNGKVPKQEKEKKEPKEKKEQSKKKETYKHIRVEKEDEKEEDDEKEESTNKNPSWTPDPTPIDEKDKKESKESVETENKPIETEKEGWSKSVDSDDEEKTALFVTFGSSKRNKMFDGGYSKQKEEEIVEAIVDVVEEKTEEDK